MCTVFKPRWPMFITMASEFIRDDDEVFYGIEKMAFKRPMISVSLTVELNHAEQSCGYKSPLEFSAQKT